MNRQQAGLLTQNMSPEQAQLLDQQLRQKQFQGRNYGGGALGNFLTSASGAIQGAAGAGQGLAERFGADRRVGLNEQQAVKSQQAAKDKQQSGIAAIVQAVDASDLPTKDKAVLKQQAAVGNLTAEQVFERLDAAKKAEKLMVVDLKSSVQLVGESSGKVMRTLVKTGDKDTPIKNIDTYTDGEGNLVDGGYQGDQFVVRNANNRLVPPEKGKTYTQVDITTDNTAELRQTLLYGSLEKSLESLEGVERTLQVFDSSLDLLDEGINTGAFANIKNQSVKLASALGLPFENELEAVARTEAYAKNQGNAVAQVIKAFGAGTGLSDKDREYAEGIAAGVITMTEEALRRLIDLQNKYMRIGIETYNKRVTAMGKGFQDLKRDVPLERRAYRGDMKQVKDPATGGIVYMEELRDTVKLFDKEGRLYKVIKRGSK